MSDSATVLAASFAALFAAHQVGDHWVQTDEDASCKGMPGPIGRGACTRHVVSLTVTKAVFLLVLALVTGLALQPVFVALGLGVDAASHWWADRRVTLGRLAELVGSPAGFWKLGAPRPGRDDNPTLGTGAYALDQSWHVAWLFVASLLISVGA